MVYTNLPGIIQEKQDGNLTITPVNENPIVMVIGTATSGDSETVFRVDRVADAVSAYGKDGTLVRGLYEAKLGGALNLRLFRIGATSAKLTLIGGGITLETVGKDNTAGNDYKLFWDDSEDRLRVWRVSDDTLVYDNYPAYQDQRVDLGEVIVYGSVSGTPGDIGTYAVPITMAAADGVSGASYTVGTDGTNLSRMELYENLYNAYQLLEDEEMDVVVPMNVYLDDLNVMDLTAAQITTRALAALAAYPTAGDTDDVLGKLYTEEYLGVNYFWWWFPADPTTSAFAAANIFPTAGLASATLKTDGTALTAADFHEVNFAYQLANFCYKQARDNMDVTGVIGVLPPVSMTPRDMSIWVGELPTASVDGTTGETVISVNGTGLLGNKWMAGRITAGGLVGHTINGVDGLYGGGFVATDDDWVDGSQLLDDNNHIVDIGKYINVVATYPVLANPSRTTAYTATGAPTYGGFYSVLPANSAPTNKQISSVRIPARLNKAKLDALAGRHYVTFHQKRRGVVVTDAPTAARADSDYFRLSTVRQVKDVIDAIRAGGEPFIGNALGSAEQAALETALRRVLNMKQKEGVIRRSEMEITVTPTMRVQGQALVELKLVPAFELRRITVKVALAAA